MLAGRAKSLAVKPQTLQGGGGGLRVTPCGGGGGGGLWVTPGLSFAWGLGFRDYGLGPKGRSEDPLGAQE